MERINELEEKIVNDYVNKAIGTVDHNLGIFSNCLMNMPIEAVSVILKYLILAPNEKPRIILARGIIQSSLEKDLSNALRKYAIDEFIRNLDSRKSAS